MSDARWYEAESDIRIASRHFAHAVALAAAGGFDAPGLDGYRAEMAFMHAVQAAHTSLENGLLRVLGFLDEEPPTGQRWHADLVRRVGNPLPGIRPAILPQALAEAADVTRRFRNLAMHGYEGFDIAEAGPAIEAARQLAADLSAALTAFRNKIDP